MKRIYYKLDGKNAVPCNDVLKWCRWFEECKDRHVADITLNNVRISTVFLGIDHAFGGALPLLFETMVFGGPLDGEQERYSTWEQAERGHAEMVYRIGQGQPKGV